MLLEHRFVARLRNLRQIQIGLSGGERASRL